MVQEIGLVVGELWRHLEANGPGTFDQIRKELGLKDGVLLMAVGWLAHEGKLSFEAAGRTFVLSLSQ